MTDTTPPLLIAPPPPGWVPPRSTASGPSGMATASLVLGIVAMVLNVLLIPTILSIVFGAIALSRGTVGRTRAIVGIVLGALGVLALAVQAAIAIPVYLGAQHAAFGSRMETSITNGFAERGVTVHDVVCAMPPSIEAGASTTCTATSESGVDLRIAVTFTDAAGGFTYRVEAA